MTGWVGSDQGEFCALLIDFIQMLLTLCLDPLVSSISYFPVRVLILLLLATLSLGPLPLS